MPGTVKLHRVFAAPPERAYKAFIDPAAKCKWLPPYGFTATMHQHDARVGGTYQMSFTNFGTGKSEKFGGTFTELVANERVRYSDKFDDPNLTGTMDVTVTFKKVMVGTEINITQAGIPDAIPVEACYLGWQESLDQLELLVEPSIPDGG